MWGFVALAAIAIAALLSALATVGANSAKAPIEATALRTSNDEVARLQETIDKLLLEQQRLAQRVEEFERTQSDLTAATPVDRKNVAWGPPPYPYGLKLKQRGAPPPLEARDRDAPIPPALIPSTSIARDKDAVAPTTPVPLRAAVPLPPAPPREKETVITPEQTERESGLQLPAPPTEKELGLAQLPAARVTETPRIMETPRGAEPLRTTETPRAVEAPRAIETARVETPRVIQTPATETTQAIVTRTEFALDLGGETSLDGLRARWASLRGNHGQTLDNLKPLVALREADQPGAFDFRLLVGPIANAADAARICARLNTTKIICAVTPYDGQHLELR